MSFRFLNKLNSTSRITGFSTSSGSFGVPDSGNASVSNPGDGKTHYTFSSPGTSQITISSSAVVDPASIEYIQGSREIRSNSSSSPITIEAHGGPSGANGGKATGEFGSPLGGKTYAVRINSGTAGPGPSGGYAGVFYPNSVSHSNSFMIGGGSGRPSGNGKPGGAGGGTSGSSSPGSHGGGGPGQASGAGGGSQSSGGSGANTGPGYGPGQSGSALQGGSGGSGDTFPGGGGGGGYYGGGGGAGGYRGDNFNSGSGGGGGSGYVHPDASNPSQQNGGSSGIKVIFKV